MTLNEELMSLAIDYVVLFIDAHPEDLGDRMEIVREVDHLFMKLNHKDQRTHDQSFANFYDLVFQTSQIGIH